MSQAGKLACRTFSRPDWKRHDNGRTAPPAHATSVIVAWKPALERSEPQVSGENSRVERSAAQPGDDMRRPWFIRRAHVAPLGEHNDDLQIGHFFAVVTCAVAIAMLSCSSANAGCDGCINSSGTCVPLAQTSREQCGRGGQMCLTWCPVCDQGMCSTGWECFGVPPPNPCECGFHCIEGVGSRSCGDCTTGTCVANRCVSGDAGTDAGALDADARTRDGG